MLVQNSLHNVIQSNDNSTLFKIVLLTKIVLKIHNCSLEFQKCDYHKVGQNVIIPIRAWKMVAFKVENLINYLYKL